MRIKSKQNVKLMRLNIARKHVEYHHMTLPRARGMFKRHLNREWGHHIARGWALLLLGPLRDYVGAQEPCLLRTRAHAAAASAAAAGAMAQSTAATGVGAVAGAEGRVAGVERPPKPENWSSMTKGQKQNWRNTSRGKWR